MSFRVKGAKPQRQYRSALPVGSVNDMHDANALQVFTCRLTPDGRYVISSASGFVFKDVDSLAKVEPWIEQMYQMILGSRKNKRGKKQ